VSQMGYPPFLLESLAVFEIPGSKIEIDLYAYKNRSQEVL